MTDKPREPFRSGVTNYSDIKKRMEEIGIKPIGDKDGVDVTPKPTEQQEPNEYGSVYGKDGLDGFPLPTEEWLREHGLIV